MVLGSTQALTEMSTRNLPGGKGRPARKADNLTAICEPTVYKMWEPRRLTTLRASTACYRDSFTIYCLLGYDAVELDVSDEGLTFQKTVVFKDDYEKLVSYTELDSYAVNYQKAIKSSILWDITHCSPLKVNRRFGGIQHLHLQSRRISRA
jgi:hypothetical protein